MSRAAPTTFDSLSSPDLVIASAVAIDGDTTTRPEGVGILSVTPAAEALLPGEVAAFDPTVEPINIVTGVE